MAGGFDKMSAEQYRQHLAGKPKPIVRPLFTPAVYESSSGTFTIEVEPMGAPRVNGNSRFNKDKIALIERYHALRDKIREDCAILGYRLGAVLKIEFAISMPPSWPDKKKREHNGRPHQQRPDIDNLTKAFMDAFKEEDSHVHTLHASKVWAHTGKIIITR